MPKAKEEVKVKTAKEHGDQFCILMNTDEKMTDFINIKVKESMDRYAAGAVKYYPTRNTKAMGELLHSARGEIMSLIAWIYGMARVKEEEMNN